MSNQDRVLRDEVDDIFDVLIDKITTRRITDKDFDTAKKITLDLINTQKRLYAESVIGEDEVFVDIPIVDHLGKVTEVIGGKSYTPYMIARNNLRADQRARIK